MGCARPTPRPVTALRTPTILVSLIVGALVWMPSGTTSADVGSAECVRPTGVQRIVFSARKYPNVRRHFRGALRRGWPRRLVLNRRGADDRSERVLRDIPIRDGFDRDEYPPAVGRGRGPGLERGRNPRGWKADVRHVPSSEPDHTALRSGVNSSRSATACASGTCSADVVSRWA
jgi:hypothetical protein